jgi:hypothetical protein
MKKILLSILMVAATGVAFGQGQGQLTATTTTTTTTAAAAATGKLETQFPKPRPPSAAPLIPNIGVVQVAIKSGHPLQMINPAAPARYGDGQDRAMHDPKDPGKPKGIVVFGWSF